MTAEAAAPTIKAIEASTVHQIQSGQVIVDLCSVAKELVENSIDAGATAVEVRFKNQGLDSIEVQDNGYGIAPHNYEGLALKHYTSKLSSYTDLDSLQTFGFRGEALSSLCALSRFTVTTCLQSDVPKATKLEFETSGKLKGTSVVAAQKGTTVTIETLFYNLPVRRRELERNIKREWGKVVNLLNQYACIQTGIKFTVSQQPTKGKRTILFSTKGNPTTRENIVNVFGAKTLSALITMDLELELEPTTSRGIAALAGDGSKDMETTTVHVRGHVSRPARGEGRQTPDRQMFYVNGRPCALPQFAKVFNEVYRAYNSTQSPFIFADIQLDTHLYDVNVSPDKRTILLHDQGRMLDNMRESLIELFEKQDVTIPVSRLQAQKLTTPFKTPVVSRRSNTPMTAGMPQSARTTNTEDLDTPSRPQAHAPASKPRDTDTVDSDEEELDSAQKPNAAAKSISLVGRWAERGSASRSEPPALARPQLSDSQTEPPKENNADDLSRRIELMTSRLRGDYSYADEPNHSSTPTTQRNEETPKTVENGPDRTHGDQRESADANTDVSDERPIPSIEPPRSQVQRAGPPASLPRSFKRPSPEVATITIGDHAVTRMIGSPSKRQKTGPKPPSSHPTNSLPNTKPKTSVPSFNGRLTQMFAAASARAAGSSGVSLTAGLRTATEEIDDDSAPESTDGVDEDEEHAEQEREEEDEEAPQKEDSEPGDELGRPGPNLDKDQANDQDINTHGADDKEEEAESSGLFVDSDADGDDEYVDEEEKKKREEEKIREMIKEVEKAAEEPSEEMQKRSNAFLKGGSRRKDSTLELVQQLKLNEQTIRQQMESWRDSLEAAAIDPNTQAGDKYDDGGGIESIEAESAEAKLSLTITKDDFAKMRIIGQFNLGFILAVRETAEKETATGSAEGRVSDDELFIIDQHASDEKYNFERLQANTVVQSQRLVRPKQLELTALEEEIIIENQAALEANGFVVEADQSGRSPVGSRCRLLSLPLSRETTFSLADLEELVSLLADNPSSGATTVPRPSRVRSMFAMRACRSSVMVGRALTHAQMGKVVRHMGDMEKPWNCPHGRPTMRHLCGLGAAWDKRAWSEGDDFGGGPIPADWSVYDGV
ncbi:hypothetical protein RB595_006363 [Gaeumannomyces hyphopodioides]